MTGRLIRIIGIDPGLRRTGWGVVDSDGVRLVYVASGHVTSDASDDLCYRLRELFEGLSSVVDLKLVGRFEFGSGAVSMRYVPRQ